MYKLGLSQNIFLEEVDNWNVRSSLSIVDSFLCCAARYAGFTVASLIYPAYNKQEQTGKIPIGTFTPLIFVILMVICRFF